MANTLKGWLADNTVTSDPNDKILVLESTGKADISKIYEEMLAEDTGLRKETIIHVTTLFTRICARLLMNGWQVNTGLFYAVPRFTGVVVGGKWDPKTNNIYVSFVQDKIVREEIAKTNVRILGEKKDVMYILETEDRKTGLKDGSLTPGRNLFIRGANLKVAGTNAAVGITLTDSKGVERKLDDDLITINKPSELTLLIPSDLAEGDYELKITTQHSSSSSLLKEPRSVTVSVHTAKNPDDDHPVID